ncbi:MAG: NDMA-dependent alcohol dehydrogenase [Microthrixaceae bacterium]|nr:NDMA-dependent alcohol dehydrogenase [Microthrixaceae bacterium]
MPTTTRTAVLWGPQQDWKVEEMTLDDPGPGEVLVEMAYAGMCHSDEHVVTGDLPVPHFPFVGGHEGSGVVTAVGPGVNLVSEGDHVSMSFIPACGHCRSCSTGHQNLCDEGAKLFDNQMMTRAAGEVSHRIGDTEAARFAQLGTFSEKILVSQSSLVRVEPDLPLDIVALVSCGVATGVGSAVHRAEVRPGQNVAVIGVGGVGINAVQGASVAGARRVIAIDPVEFKREKAMEMGATHTYSSVEEALLAVPELTWGEMCDSVILSPGVVTGDMVEPSLNLVSKGGTLVITALAGMLESDVQLNLFMLAMMNKAVKGTVFGSGNPRADIPELLSMYREGVLKLDQLITNRYSLDDVNQGYQDMRDGKNIRGVIEF